MSYVTTLFLLLFAINVLLAWGLIWTRRNTWMRHMALPYIVAALPVFALVAMETLGRHKPALVAWAELSGRQQVVLGHKAVPGRAIYVYLDIGEEEPRAIMLPWSARMARKLQGEGDDKGNGELLVEGTRKWIMEFEVKRMPPPPPNPPKMTGPQAPHLENTW